MQYFHGYCVFFKQVPAVIIPFFKDIELIGKSTNLFKFTVFLQNKKCIKNIS